MCRERQQVWAAGSLDVNHQLGLSHEQRCAYGVMRCMLRQKRVLERRSRADKDEYEKGSHGERNLRKHAEQTAPLSECSRKPQSFYMYRVYTLFGWRSGKAASLDGGEATFRPNTCIDAYRHRSCRAVAPPKNTSRIGIVHCTRKSSLYIKINRQAYRMCFESQLGRTGVNERTLCV